MPAAFSLATGIETEKIFVLLLALSGKLNASAEFIGDA
jgi:hypothetical protein